MKIIFADQPKSVHTRSSVLVQRVSFKDYREQPLLQNMWKTEFNERLIVLIFSIFLNCDNKLISNVCFYFN